MKNVLEIINDKSKKILEIEKEKEALKIEEEKMVKNQDPNIRRHIPIKRLEENLKDEQRCLLRMKKVPAKILKIVSLIAGFIAVGIVAILLSPAALALPLALSILGILSTVKILLLHKNFNSKQIQKKEQYIDRCIKEIAVLKEEEETKINRNKRIAELNNQMTRLLSEITNELLNFKEVGSKIPFEIMSQIAQQEEILGILTSMQCLSSSTSDKPDDIVAQVRANQLTKHN